MYIVIVRGIFAGPFNSLNQANRWATINLSGSWKVERLKEPHVCAEVIDGLCRQAAS